MKRRKTKQRKAKRAKKESKMGRSKKDIQGSTSAKKDDDSDSSWTERRKRSRRRHSHRSPSSSSSSSTSSRSSDSAHRSKLIGSERSGISRRKWTSTEPRSESNRSSMNEAYFSSTEVLNHTAVSQEHLPFYCALGDLAEATTMAKAKETIANSANEEATDSDNETDVVVSRTQPPTPDMAQLQRHLAFTPMSPPSEKVRTPKTVKRMKIDQSDMEKTPASNPGHDASISVPSVVSNEERDSKSSSLKSKCRSLIKSVVHNIRSSPYEAERCDRHNNSTMSPSFKVPMNQHPSSSSEIQCCSTPTQYARAFPQQLDLLRRRSLCTQASPELSSSMRRSVSDVIPIAAANVQGQLRRKSYGLVSYDVDEFTNADNLKFIDTHCHLDFLFKRLDMNLSKYQSYRRYYDYCYPKSYEGCIAIFCDPKTFGKRDLWSAVLDEKGVWAAFGCHPHMARQYNDEVEGHLIEALKHDKVVALGEIGLDYSHKNNCDREIQKEVFRKQLSIAKRLDKPLVIHSRDSAEDTLEILKKEITRDHKIHRHCFTSNWSEAQVWLNTFPNLYIGLTALCTYPTATPVHEVARKISLSRLLLETDAPYFLPRHADKLCKWSHPGMAIHVASQIAALRRDSMLEDVIVQTRNNTRQLFGI